MSVNKLDDTRTKGGSNGVFGAQPILWKLRYTFTTPVGKVIGDTLFIACTGQKSVEKNHSFNRSFLHLMAIPAVACDETGRGYPARLPNRANIGATASTSY